MNEINIELSTSAYAGKLENNLDKTNTSITKSFKDLH
jgi:hypothetical protein